MKATEKQIKDFLASNEVQFVIPVYQRNYDWSVGQCRRLLDDILEAGKNQKRNAHFMGSIVYIHDDVYTTSSVKDLTIIDGQQRITTLTLIYLVLHRLAKELCDEGLADKILETFLINKFAAEEEKLKLRPTENNDKALKCLLRYEEHEISPAYSKLIGNFNFFKKKITKDNYQVVLQGLSKLMFVEISLDRTYDDPQRIFESLNSTGLDLSQADLIRNYILMGLRRADQNKIYRNYWEVIEQSAKDETLNIPKVSDFIRDFLTLENNKIPNKGDVYTEFKDKYPIMAVDELKTYLEKIKGFAKHYNKLLNPKKEIDKDIQLQLEYISRLEISVSFPFLMQVYDDYDRSIIDKRTFIRILGLIQSYTWRRFVLGLPTSTLNKVFMTLYEKVDLSNYLYSIQKSLLLKQGTQRFPANSEVIDALKFKDVYNIKPKSRDYFLDRLENFENTAEYVIVVDNPNITIEHIFPQIPNLKWKIELGNEEFTFIKENYLHTIGNLTLSGNNGKLGNKSFTEKRDLPEVGYRASRLHLNQYIATLKKWNRKEIEKRFEWIAARFLKIWEYPDIKVESDEFEKGEVNIFDVDDPTNKRLEYAIFFDEKIEETQITKFYVEIIKRLFVLQPGTFFSTELGQRIGLSTDEEKHHLREAAPISETYFIETNCSSLVKFTKIKQALTFFELQDELTIKFAD
ncbi:MAG: DUF262 domain-containing protein [Planctomycetaceae bacterium]|jgi:uncharacterized protein with ParB-like and HNH nuclease domain|nr:DUF262 domain-containing protein [Planctomycetaceae bacterium]